MSGIAALGFGSTVQMLSDAMTGAGMEHQAIAENIANVDTPNYRRQGVSFKEALAASQPSSPDPGTLAMRTDDPRQFAVGGTTKGQPFDPQFEVDRSTQMRVDGNNVDVDQAMARLSQNSAYSQTMEQLLQVQFMRLRSAITE